MIVDASGRDIVEVDIAAREAGADGVMAKPIDRRKLLELLETLPAAAPGDGGVARPSSARRSDRASGRRLALAAWRTPAMAISNLPEFDEIGIDAGFVRDIAHADRRPQRVAVIGRGDEAHRAAVPVDRFVVIEQQGRVLHGELHHAALQHVLGALLLDARPCR